MKKNFAEVTIIIILITLVISTVVASGLTSGIYPSAGKVKTRYDEIYYKVANRIYQDYKSGKTTTEIALKGVEFNNISEKAVNRVNSILMSIDGLAADIEETKQGDITVIRAAIRQSRHYKNSDELNSKLDNLVDEANKKSTIREKLGYINDKIVKESTYGRATMESSISAEGVLINNMAVCEGFANLVYELCQRLGIKETPIYGHDHVANMVYVDNQWYLWDLTWNVGSGYGTETFYYAKPTDNGDIDIITGPGERQYFLLGLDGPQIERYFDDAGTIKELGESEMIKAIRHPEMSNIDLSLGSLEIDIDSVEMPEQSSNPIPSNPIQSNPSVTPAPIKHSVPDIIIDGQGNIIKQPSKPIASIDVAKPNSSTVLINGKKVAFEAYGINGYNYFKLRDLAMALNGSSKQFQVEWDGKNNAVRITSKTNYTTTGGELTVSNTTSVRNATATTSKIYIDNKEVSFKAYGIVGNNYLRLRDIGKALDFGVAWDGANNTIRIDTNTGYTE